MQPIARAFYLYFIVKLSKSGAFMLFLVSFYQSVAMETVMVTKIVLPISGIYIQSTVTIITEKMLSQMKSFQFLVSDRLKGAGRSADLKISKSAPLFLNHQNFFEY